MMMPRDKATADLHHDPKESTSTPALWHWGAIWWLAVHITTDIHAETLCCQLEQSQPSKPTEKRTI